MKIDWLFYIWFILVVVALAALPSCDSFAPVHYHSLAIPPPPLGARPFPKNVIMLQASQLLEFEEPTTGVKVKLVGTMHYNPASIQLAKDTIEALARENKLGSVVIESCDLRWNQTTDMDPFLQRVLNSEMKAACDLALEYERPVVLGDQRINETVSYIGAGFKETLRHLVDPVEGWQEFATSLKLAREMALPFGDDANLNVKAILDPQLLVAAPVSLAKYPLSYLVKSPLFSIGLFSLLFFLDRQSGSVPMDEMTALDWIGSLSFASLETALLARVFLKELLADRNHILAQNILEQCKLYRPNKKCWGNLPFVSRNGGKKDPNVVYVDGSNVHSSVAGDEMEIVAVVGMAHSNGIMKLLKEQRV